MLSVYQGVFENDQQISAISFGNENGEYIGLRRSEQRSDFDLMLRDPIHGAHLSIFSGMETDKRLQEIDGYDPRLRPWYKVARNQSKGIWSKLYVNQDERRQIAMSFSAPVLDGQRQLGVVATDISLDGLNAYLKSERSGLGGIIAIVDPDGALISHSEPGSITRVSNATGTLIERIRMLDSPNPVMREAAAHLAGLPPEGSGTFKMRYGEELYFARAEPYARQPGIDWRIIAILPESALLAEAKKSQTTGFVVACSLGLAGLWIGIWVIGMITRPILNAAEAARELSLGHLSSLREDSTPLKETAILMRAFSEMAERLQTSFNRLRELVLVDDLSGLPTRRGLVEQVSWQIPRRCALFLVGIDDFRTVNDILGFTTGDQLLRIVAARLVRLVPPPLFVARTGGDEFAVLFALCENSPGIDSIGQEILRSFDEAFEINRDALTVRASTGSVDGYVAQEHFSEWLRQASAALGEAKLRGGGRHVMFDEKILDATINRGRLVSELRQAVIQDEFVAYYQPIVELSSGKVTALEALVRWRHPVRGLLPPAEFIALCEESDLIVQIGEFMLRRACTDIAEHQRTTGRILDIHVNVSARQVLQSTFLDFVLSTLRQAGLQPEQLTIELTESLFIGTDDTGIAYLFNGLKAIGVRIAIDDFGTGYSSLSYLERLPIDCLKIDRSFIQKIDDPSTRSAALAASIIDVGRKLGLETVAEGVETPAQAAQLRKFGCVRAQGYLYGRPLPFSEMDFSDRHD
jgi:diguanylate cyclase (GGDEF)-like protein